MKTGLLVSFLASVSPGCDFLTTGTGATDEGANTGNELDEWQQQQIEDAANAEAAWDEMAHRLDQQAVSFLTNVSRHAWASGNRVYAVRSNGARYELLSVDLSHQDLIEYAFDPAMDQTYSVSTDQDRIVDPETEGSTVRYTMYDASQPNAALGSVVLPKPPDASYYDYSLSEGVVYFVQEPQIHRWQPGGELETIAELPDLGIYNGGVVSGGVLYYQVNSVMAGLVLATGESFSLGARGSVECWKVVRGKVLFSDSRRLAVFDIEQRSTRDLTGEIEALDYRVVLGAPSFSHKPDTMQYGVFDMLDDDTVVYRGALGIFSYSLTARQVTPILMDNEDNEDLHPLVHAWDTPVVTDSGHLFVIRAQAVESAGLDMTPDMFAVDWR